jgi:hypothetical protein
MCNTGSTEDIEHLFFSCLFARQCWAWLNFAWDLPLNLEDRIVQVKQTNGQEFFMEAAMIGAWELWNLRMTRCSVGRSPILQDGLAILNSSVMYNQVDLRLTLNPAFVFG